MYSQNTDVVKVGLCFSRGFSKKLHHIILKAVVTKLESSFIEISVDRIYSTLI